MSIQIRDTISPALAKLAGRIKDKGPLLEAMGTQLVSITKRSFTDEGLRPAPWPARAGTSIQARTSKTGKTRNVIVGGDGATEHNLLRKSGALWQSIRITNVTGDAVTVGSDRIYAAVQQLGAIIRAKGKALSFVVGGRRVFVKKVTIPARPFFPFTKDGRMTAIAQSKIEAVLRTRLATMLREMEG